MHSYIGIAFMNDCLFCKIASGEQKSDVAYQDENIIIFRDVNPKAPIHLLIVPKKHIESIIALEEGDGEIIALMIFAAKKMAEEMDLDGYKLAINVGKKGGQIIDHLHMHFLSGWKDVNGKNIKV